MNLEEAISILKELDKDSLMHGLAFCKREEHLYYSMLGRFTYYVCKRNKIFRCKGGKAKEINPERVRFDHNKDWYLFFQEYPSFGIYQLKEDNLQ